MMWQHHSLLGATGDARVGLYQHALARAGLPPAAIIDYRDVVQGRVDLADRLATTKLLRIESPGRDFEVYKALLAHGYEEARRSGLPTIEPHALHSLVHQRGLLLCPSQYFLGFRRVLDEVNACLDGSPSLKITSHPQDIAILFDKRQCHRTLSAAGIAVPRALSDGVAIRSYEQLREAMARSRVGRVFIKLRYGSSAAGVVAYQVSGLRELAITTAELSRNECQTAALFCSRRVRRYENRDDIRTLIDTLCMHEVHVEAWFPKAAVGNAICDLRVLTIAGEPRHIVLRSSQSPLTNLHLLNQRSDAEPLRQRMRPDAWDALMETCTRVAARFSRTLHLGIDVAVRVGFRDHAVLEVNAFGDLLKDVTDRGQTTHEAEIDAISHQLERAA